MDNIDKFQERANLRAEFMIFISPLGEIAGLTSAPERDDYLEAFSNIDGCEFEFLEEVTKFSTFGDKKHRKEDLHARVAFSSFNNKYLEKLKVQNIINPDEFHNEFKEDLKKMITEFIDIIYSIPIDFQSNLTKPNTPFTTHLRILDCISSARNDLDYFDPYLKSNFFHLYLRYLDPSINLTLSY